MPINVQADDQAKAKNDLDNDLDIVDFKTKSPAELVAWIETNVTDLATTKTALKLLTRAVIYLLKRVD